MSAHQKILELADSAFKALSGPADGLTIAEAWRLGQIVNNFHNKLRDLEASNNAHGRGPTNNIRKDY